MPKLLKRIITFVICVIIIAVTAFCSREYIYKLIYPLKYEESVEYASNQFDVDKALIYSVIKCESNFDKDALSKTQAIGLMQIMPDTFVWLREKNPHLPKANVSQLYDPEINIIYGSFYLSILLDKFENEETAIAAYNAGPGVVEKWINDKKYSIDGLTLNSIPYKETENYVKKVVNSRKIYRTIYFDD